MKPKKNIHVFGIYFTPFIEHVDVSQMALAFLRRCLLPQLSGPHISVAPPAQSHNKMWPAMVHWVHKLAASVTAVVTFGWLATMLAPRF